LAQPRQPSRVHPRGRRGHDQLAIGFLFGLGLRLGGAVAPVIAGDANADPAAQWQAAGATAAFVAACAAYGYATRRDLSSWARTLFWALLTLIVLGSSRSSCDPGSNVIYGVLGLVIFGGFTIFDFNRLRRASTALMPRGARSDRIERRRLA
jgi:modulator of FtsH protease